MLDKSLTLSKNTVYKPGIPSIGSSFSPAIRAKSRMPARRNSPEYGPDAPPLVQTLAEMRHNPVMMRSSLSDD